MMPIPRDVPKLKVVSPKKELAEGEVHELIGNLLAYELFEGSFGESVTMLLDSPDIGWVKVVEKAEKVKEQLERNFRGLTLEQAVAPESPVRGIKLSRTPMEKEPTKGFLNVTPAPASTPTLLDPDDVSDMPKREAPAKPASSPVAATKPAEKAPVAPYVPNGFTAPSEADLKASYDAYMTVYNWVTDPEGPIGVQHLEIASDFDLAAVNSVIATILIQAKGR